MFTFVPLSRRLTRPLSWLVLVVWTGVMAILVNRSYLQATGSLATRWRARGARGLP